VDISTIGIIVGGIALASALVEIIRMMVARFMPPDNRLVHLDAESVKVILEGLRGQGLTADEARNLQDRGDMHRKYDGQGRPVWYTQHVTANQERIVAGLDRIVETQVQLNAAMEDHLRLLEKHIETCSLLCHTRGGP